MEKYINKLPITEWAENDRPREKMQLKGINSLSDAELIAILIGSGSRNESAVELSKRILSSVNGNLIELSKLTINDLVKNFNGIGNAKAISIIAALELGKRRRSSEIIIKEKITTSKDAFELLHGLVGDSQYEEFWIILLNKAHKIIKTISISEGGIAGTVADPKKIFKIALENGASSIVLCHNHPSGNLKASDNDISLTKKLKQAGLMLDIQIIDHIIIGDDKYFSFADEGIL